MLPISFARHSSSMPMQRIAFQRQCETQQCSSVALRIDALTSLCTCFFAPRFSAPLHVLWPLIPRSAWQPQQFQSLSSLRHCKSGRVIAVPLHVSSFRSAQCSSHLCRSVARLLDAHRCNSSAIRVTAMPMPRSQLLSKSIAPQSSTLLFHCWS